MELPAPAIIVRELPATIDAKQARALVSDLACSIAAVVRPCVVLDCAQVRRIDDNFLHLLLCCLEEAMKRNGDVRLSGIPEAARPALEAIGMERLFRFFSTTAQAAESFRRPATLVTASASSQDTAQPSAHAA